MTGGFAAAVRLDRWLLRERLPDDPRAPGSARESAVQAEQREKPEPPWALVLHNDDLNSFGFVAKVLSSVLSISVWRALALAVRVHVSGRGVVWRGARDAAEEHARRIRDFGPDPHGKPGARPLTVTVEPAS